MLILPFLISETDFSIFIGLDDTSIDRIKKYDPAIVSIRETIIPEHFHGKSLSQVIVGFANDFDLKMVIDMKAKDATSNAVMKALMRGFEYRPDLGDHDGPPLNVTPNPDESKH